MIIGTIKDGIVIDHIPAGRCLELYRYMGLDKLDCEVALIKNADSDKHGRKDIIKINQIIDLDHSMLGYISPNITVNVIKDGQRVEKFHPEAPERLVNVITCKNPRCITSVEQELQQIFQLTDKEKNIYRCIYCESTAK